MADIKKVIKGLEYHLKELSVGKTCFKCPYCGDNPCEIHLIADALELLKEQEAVKPRVSTVEQRCGNCNKVIEMDGWKACPWCGKPILWEAVGRSVK